MRHKRVVVGVVIAAILVGGMVAWSAPRLLLAQPTVELFGHVTLVEGYALPAYNGCHALVMLRDAPGGLVAVMSREPRLQSLLETALSTGDLIAFHGKKNLSPLSPRGGTWGAMTVYDIDGVTVYK
jgi:hypothetical protein